MKHDDEARLTERVNHARSARLFLIPAFLLRSLLFLAAGGIVGALGGIFLGLAAFMIVGLAYDADAGSVAGLAGLVLSIAIGAFGGLVAAYRTQFGKGPRPVAVFPPRGAPLDQAQRSANW